MDENLQTNANMSKECIGLIITKDESNNKLSARVTSWDCNQNTSFVCSLEASKFSSPAQLTGFPCIPRNKGGREKRQSNGAVDSGKKSKTAKCRGVYSIINHYQVEIFCYQFYTFNFIINFQISKVLT